MGCCSSNDAIDENSQPGRAVELTVDHNVIDVDNWWEQHTPLGVENEMEWQLFLSSYTSTIVVPTVNSKSGSGKWGKGGAGGKDVESILSCVIDRSPEEEAGGVILKATFLRFVLRFGPLELTYDKVVNNIFNQYMAPDKTVRLMLASWFHGRSITRREVQRVFRREPVGTYLVRFSETYPAKLTVSVVISAKIAEADRAGAGGKSRSGSRPEASGAAQNGRYKSEHRRADGVVSNYVLTNEGQYGYSLNCSLPMDADGDGTGAGVSIGLDDINNALYPNVFELLSASPQLFKIAYPSKLHFEYMDAQREHGLHVAASGSCRGGGPVHMLQARQPDSRPSSVATSAAASVVASPVGSPNIGGGLALCAQALTFSLQSEQSPDVTGYGAFEEPVEEENENDVKVISATSTIPMTEISAEAVGVDDYHDAIAGLNNATDDKGAPETAETLEEAQEEEEYEPYGEFVEETETEQREPEHELGSTADERKSDGVVRVNNYGRGGNLQESEWESEELYENAPADALLQSLCTLAERFDANAVTEMESQTEVDDKVFNSRSRGLQTVILKQLVDRLRFQLESCVMEVSKIGSSDNSSSAMEITRKISVGMRVCLGVLTALACYSGARVDASPICLEDSTAVTAHIGVSSSEVSSEIIGAIGSVMQKSQWLALRVETREGFLDLIAAAEVQGADPPPMRSLPLDLLKLFIETFYACSRWNLLLYRLLSVKANGVAVSVTNNKAHSDSSEVETACKIDAGIGFSEWKVARRFHLTAAKEMAEHSLACIRRLRSLASNSGARSSPRLRVQGDLITIASLESAQDFNGFQHECTSLYSEICLHAATVMVLLALCISAADTGSDGEGNGNMDSDAQAAATSKSKKIEERGEVDNAVTYISAAMEEATSSKTSALISARSSSTSVEGNDIKFISIMITGVNVHRDHGCHDSDDGDGSHDHVNGGTDSVTNSIGGGEYFVYYGVNSHAWRTMLVYLREERNAAPDRMHDLSSVDKGKDLSLFASISSNSTQQLLADGIRLFSGRQFPEAMKTLFAALKSARCCGDVELEIRAAVNYGTVKYKLLTPRLAVTATADHNKPQTVAPASVGLPSVGLLSVLDELQEIIGLYVYSVALVRQLRSAKIVHHASQAALGHRRQVDVRHDATDGRTEASIGWLDADAVPLVAKVVAYHRDRAVANMTTSATSSTPGSIEVTSVDFERKVLFSLCQILCHGLRFLNEVASASGSVSTTDFASASRSAVSAYGAHLAVVHHLYRVNRVFFMHFIQQLLLICNK